MHAGSASVFCRSYITPRVHGTEEKNGSVLLINYICAPNSRGGSGTIPSVILNACISICTVEGYHIRRESIQFLRGLVLGLVA